MRRLISVGLLVCAMFFGFMITPRSVSAFFVCDVADHGSISCEVSSVGVSNGTRSWVEVNSTRQLLALVKGPEDLPLRGDAYNNFGSPSRDVQPAPPMKVDANLVLSNHERETGWYCPSFDKTLPRRSAWKEEMMGAFFADNVGCLFSRVIAQGWFDFGYVGDRGLEKWCAVDYLLVVTNSGNVVMVTKDLSDAGGSQLRMRVETAGWYFFPTSGFYNILANIDYLSLLSVTKSSTITEVTDVVIAQIMGSLSGVKSMKVAEYFMPYEWQTVPTFYLDPVDVTQANVCQAGMNTSNIATGVNCGCDGSMGQLISM